MTGIAHEAKDLRFSEKLSRLAVRLRDPEWRRYGRALLAGKLMGVAAVLLVMFAMNLLPALPDLLGGSAIGADEATKAAEPLYPAVKAGDIVNPINSDHGRWSPRSSSSAYESASRCSRPASAGRARRSTS